jgi:hypothetical protein
MYLQWRYHNCVLVGNGDYQVDQTLVVQPQYEFPIHGASWLHSVINEAIYECMFIWLAVLGVGLYMI